MAGENSYVNHSNTVFKHLKCREFLDNASYAGVCVGKFACTAGAYEMLNEFQEESFSQ